MFKCLVNPFTLEAPRVPQGIFESSSLPGAKIRWSAKAVEVMSSVKQNALPKVKLAVERYCLDIRAGEVRPRHIFNAKPDIRAIYNVPFSMNYDKHFGSVASVAFSPFDKRIFLSCSSDASLRVSAQFDVRELIKITRFAGIKEIEPDQGDRAGLTDVKWSLSRPTVLAASSGQLVVLFSS